MWGQRCINCAAVSVSALRICSKQYSTALCSSPSMAACITSHAHRDLQPASAGSVNWQWTHALHSYRENIIQVDLWNSPPHHIKHVTPDLQKPAEINTFQLPKSCCCIAVAAAFPILFLGAASQRAKGIVIDIPVTLNPSACRKHHTMLP